MADAVAQALSLYSIGLFAGFAVMNAVHRIVGRGEWIWLRGLGDRLWFMIFPRPPGNIVRLVLPHGDNLMFSDVRVSTARDSMVLETPVGHVEVPDVVKAVVPFSSIYVRGVPSPMHVTISAMAGWLAVYIVVYYGGLFALNSLPIALTGLGALAYAFIWFNFANIPNTEYYSLVVRSLSPPTILAEPMIGEMVSPIRASRYSNTPIVIRVSREAEKVIDEVRQLLHTKSVSLAAEILSVGELYRTMLAREASLAARLRRESVRTSLSYQVASEVKRATLAKAIVWAVFFLLGVVVGWALFGGGDVVITTSPLQAQPAPP